MTFPGPPSDLWAIELLLWAAQATVLGEVARWVGARWVSVWRVREPVERLLLDFYLGGAVMYLVAALPIGAFSGPVVVGIPVAAAVTVLFRAVRRWQRALPRSEGSGPTFPLDLWTSVAFLSALGLYLIELVAATGVGTGNTFDSSLLTTYVSLLLQHHSLPVSFQPYASSMILYPQGTTTWLGWAQLDFGLPPARTSLLVTPLFLALPPLAGFVFGRRILGTNRAGAGIALAFAWLGPVSRSLVGGSNDLAFAVPLVLLLGAQAGLWTRSSPPTVADAVGYGLLVGYSAALNPVGAEWLLPALLGLGLFTRPMFSGAAGRWLLRWGCAAGSGFVGIAPSIYVGVLGLGSPGLVPGAPGPPASVPVGIDLSQLIGSVDPFLFRAGDVELSPVPILRSELAILVGLGLALLLLVRRSSTGPGYLGPARRWLAAVGASLGAWFLLLLGAGAGFSVLRPFAYVSSAPELSLWLFTAYSLLASVPLVLLLERAAWSGRLETSVTVDRPRLPRLRGAGRRTIAPIAAALLLLVPGVVLTPTSLAPVLGTLYQDFGNVSAADFQLLSYAGGVVPPGSRVLVAPGSAAEFLPGYLPEIVLLYPMVPGWQWINASYAIVVRELTNGTLDRAGGTALTALHVDFIAITGNNTVLWPAFLPGPILGNASFTPVFHAGDAYLFRHV